MLDDLLEDWAATVRRPFEGIRVLGTCWSPRSHLLKEFLSRNQIPYRWLDVETDREARPCWPRKSTEAEPRLPVLLFPDGSALEDPGQEDMARRAGADRPRHPRAGRPGRPAAAGGPPLLRPGHHRRRAGGAGGRGLRRLRGAAHGAGRAGGHRRAGGHERAHRELPGLPAGPERGRPGPPGHRPGPPLRGGDPQRGGGGRAGRAPLPRHPPERRRRAGLPGPAHRHGGLRAPPRGARRRAAGRGGRLLRGGHLRGRPLPGQGRGGGRRGQLGGAGGALPLPLRAHGHPGGPRRRRWRPGCRTTWSTRSRPPANIQVLLERRWRR